MPDHHPTIEELKAIPEAEGQCWEDEDYEATVFYLTLLWLIDHA